MAKTKGQLDKKKRETEKRKQIEKAVLKIAAGMPDDDPKTGSSVPTAGPRAVKGKP
jgi:hypothetical protein